MRLTNVITLFLTALFSVTNLVAHDKWDLRRCVEYELRTNISIKQVNIGSWTYKLYYDQAKVNQLGTLNGATALGLNFGRSIDQTTNIYTNTQGLSQYYNLQANINLFNWFALKRASESNKFNYKAQVVNID